MDGWKKRAAEHGTPIKTVCILLPEGTSLFWKVYYSFTILLHHVLHRNFMFRGVTFECCEQIINTTGFSKTGQYIADACTDVMDEIRSHAPAVSVSGFIMDSASANRSAMANLDESHTYTEQYGPLVNLQCLSHTLSFLLKDLDLSLIHI